MSAQKQPQGSYTVYVTMKDGSVRVVYDADSRIEANKEGRGAVERMNARSYHVVFNGRGAR